MKRVNNVKTNNNIQEFDIKKAPKAMSKKKRSRNPYTGSSSSRSNGKTASKQRMNVCYVVCIYFILIVACNMNVKCRQINLAASPCSYCCAAVDFFPLLLCVAIARSLAYLLTYLLIRSSNFSLRIGDFFFRLNEKMSKTC